MTLNKFLEAIAFKLINLWPDRHVFVNEIPKDSDGNFFIRVVEITQEKKLDRRRRKTVQFEILYFLASKDNLEFNLWAETMLDEFETILVCEETEPTNITESDILHSIRLSNISARKDSDSRVFQFLFDADFYFLLASEEIPDMYFLCQDNTVRSEVIKK